MSDPKRPEPGWTSSMEGEPPIGLLPDGKLNVVNEDECEDECEEDECEEDECE